MRYVCIISYTHPVDTATELAGLVCYLVQLTPTTSLHISRIDLMLLSQLHSRCLLCVDSREALQGCTWCNLESMAFSPGHT